MKIKIEGSQGGVRSSIEERLLNERCEVSINGDGEVLRVETFVGTHLADITVEAVFGSKPDAYTPDPFSIVRAFDGKKFKNQTMLLLPFVGSMSEGLGFPCDMGCCMKFIQKPSWQDDGKLVEFLEEMNFSGMVTLEYNQTRVQRITLGVPHFGAFALMERWPSDLLSFDKQDNDILFREGWMVASLIAAYPFPWNIEETEKGVRVDGISDNLIKHFWPFSRSGVKQGRFTSVDCVLGIATAWEQGQGCVNKMIERLLWTCQNLTAPMKMYRVDLIQTIHRKLDRVREFLV